MPVPKQFERLAFWAGKYYDAFCGLQNGADPVGMPAYLVRHRRM